MPQAGQDRIPLPHAETSQRPSRNMTLSTSTPGPKPNVAIFRMPHLHAKLKLSKPKHRK
jgi:hypothetical protein